jgi:hypothetical protein
MISEAVEQADTGCIRALCWISDLKRGVAMKTIHVGAIKENLNQLQDDDAKNMDALRALFKNKYVQVDPDDMSAELRRLKGIMS